MKSPLKLFVVSILALNLLSLAWAQGGAQTQPVDPTAQAPTTSAPPASADATPEGVRMFAGSIAHQKSGFVLKAGNASYKLDDQSLAKQFKGKNVQVTGSLDKNTNTIHVEKIEPSASM
jgi:hypothetical protein